jgi:hypothetical protein
MVNSSEEEYEKRIDATLKNIVRFIHPASVYVRLRKPEFRELTRRIVDMQNLGDSEENIIRMMRSYSQQIVDSREGNLT